MEIKTITAENLFCFGNMEIKFDSFGQLTLIEGRNLDATVAESNGAGKTSVYETLLWIYYDTTKKGLTGNDVVNERMISGGVCYGESEFIQGGKSYIIRRTRNGECKLSLKMLTSEGLYLDLTKGTAKETQELLESIIKMSPLTFSKMTYFGQEDIKSFAGLSDKELKSVFEQALGVEFITSDHEKVKSVLKNKTSESAVIETEIATKGEKEKAFNEKVDYLMKADGELKEQQKSEADRLEAELKDLKDRYIEVTSEIKTISDNLSAKMGVLPSYKDDRDKLMKLKINIDEVMTSIKSKLMKTKLEADINERTRKETMGLYAHAEESIGKPCDACDREFTPDDIAKYKKRLAGKFSMFEEKKEAIGRQMEDLKIQVDRNATLEANLTDKMLSLNEQVNTLEKEINAYNANLRPLKHDHGRIQKEIETKNKLITDLKGKNIGYADDIERTRKHIDELNAEISRLLSDISTLSKEINTINLLRQILSDGGLKNYIFNAITPELNRLANEYLQVLENIEVEITTVKQLKNGEFRDKFDINVINHSGSAKYKGNSGGERKKIDFAISLAFNSVIRSMSEESCNILFLDEPFEGIDEAGSERAVELIEKITGGTKAFLIAHNQYIKDLTFETMTIEKKGGFSTIKLDKLSK